MNQKQDIFAVLDGRVKFYRSEYNITSDPVWLAASVATPKKHATVLDIGVGSGGVALCLMARIPGLLVTGIDISTDMIVNCEKNSKLNGREIELINADILKWRTNRTFDIVITNPPYFKGIPRKTQSDAHHNADIFAWVRAGLKRLKPLGHFYCIVDAACTGEVIHALVAGKCGDINMRPLFGMGKTDTAERVLISARLGSHGGSKIHSGLAMNNDKILRQINGINDL